MAQMWQYVIFLSLKPTKVTSDYILYKLKRVVGGATTHIFYMDPAPGPGSLGCQKVRQGPLNMLFEVLCTNIAHKMKIRNTHKKRGFFFYIFSILMVLKFVPFGGNISAKHFYL